jgi:hypothetical protein
MNYIRPATYAELRNMIKEAKLIDVNAPLGLGQISEDPNSYIPFPVTKSYALSLYKGFSGPYNFDGVATAEYETVSKHLRLN